MISSLIFSLILELPQNIRCKKTGWGAIKNRTYFGSGVQSYYQGYSGTHSITHEFRGSAGTPIFTLTNGGSALFNGSVTAYANSGISGDLSLFNGIGVVMVNNLVVKLPLMIHHILEYLQIQDMKK